MVWQGAFKQESEQGRGRLVPAKRRATDKTRGRGHPRPILERTVPYPMPKRIILFTHRFFCYSHRLSARNAGVPLGTRSGHGAGTFSGQPSRSAVNARVSASVLTNDILRCKRKPGGSRNDPGSKDSRQTRASELFRSRLRSPRPGAASRRSSVSAFANSVVC